MLQTKVLVPIDFHLSKKKLNRIIFYIPKQFVKLFFPAQFEVLI